MHKKWAVKHHQACLGGNRYLPDPVTIATFWTKRGAQKATRSQKFRDKHMVILQWWDKLQTHQISKEEHQQLKETPREKLRTKLRKNTVPYYQIPSIDGQQIPIHPNMRKQYQQQLDRALKLTKQ